MMLPGKIVFNPSLTTRSSAQPTELSVPPNSGCRGTKALGHNDNDQQHQAQDWEKTCLEGEGRGRIPPTLQGPLYPYTNKDKMSIDKFHTLTFRLSNTEPIIEASIVTRTWITNFTKFTKTPLPTQTI